MATRYYANAPATQLASGISAAATQLTVESDTGLPITYPYTLIIDRGQATEEVVDVTAATGTTLTVTRGVDNTLASAHSIGATVEHGISARDVREANEHINDSTGVHGLGATDSVVGTDTAQTLTNKDLSDPSNTFPSTLVTADSATTLTNKTLSVDTNTVSGLAASSFALTNASGNLDGTAAAKAVPTGAVVGTTDTQTLSNKTLSSPTITEGSSWTSYTPTWTGTGSNPSIGNGTLQGQYYKVGRMVVFKIKVIMGSTTTFGSGIWAFTLPFQTADVEYAIGGARLVDGSANQSGAVFVDSNTTCRVVHSTGSVSNTSPFTWASGDTLTFTGTYEATS